MTEASALPDHRSDASANTAGHCPKKLFYLATRAPHAFGDKINIPANATLHRHNQTERSCIRCKLVKITVHPTTGNAWREWRWGDSTHEQFIDPIEPECTATHSEAAE
jgi:hypothetical protein